ncbi:MAG: thiolase family protein [bacterium]
MRSDTCAIVGLGVTEVGHLPGRSVLMLEVEAARLALQDARLEAERIGAAIQLLSDTGGGVRARHHDSFARVLNLPVNVYMENVGRGGEYVAHALIIASSLLEHGVAEYVLCAGARDDWSRSQTAKAASGRAGQAFAPKTNMMAQLFGGNAVTYHGLLASRHMYEYGTTSAQLGAVAVAQRRWANLNPSAYMHRKSLTLEDHQNSPVVVWPYRLFDICLQSDGGVAFVVTTADRARDLRKPPVHVAGIGFGEQMSDLWWKKSNYTTLAVRSARDNAFRQAGVQLSDIDVAQLYDCFTGEVVIQVEDYGWCEKGEGGAFVAEMRTAPGGQIPTNTGGGLLSSHHLGNLTGLAEAVTQLRGEGKSRQVEGAEVAVVSGHGAEVLSGQMCSIHSTVVLRSHPYH